MSNLSTVDAVVDALGGTTTVAKLIGRTAPAVSNWRKIGLFPANTYITIRRALKERRLSAPDSLWPMNERADA